MKKFRSPLLGALSFVALPLSLASAQTTPQTQYFVLGASDAQQNDEFSSGMALDGDRMVVGAARADIGPTSSTANQGITYVYDFDGTSWVEQAILRASDAALADEFGSDVALQGDRFVSGARLHDLTPSGNEGAAYVFEFDGTSWNETAKLTANNPGIGDNFGSTIRIEGDFVFVASPFDDAAGSTLGDEGSVTVFHYDGTSWTQTQKLVAADAEETELFGASLGLDGDRLVVGAEHELTGTFSEAGAVYVFEYDGASWLQTAKVMPGVRHNDQHFGSSVDVDGDRLLVGAEENNSVAGQTRAGALWVFEYDGMNWVQVARLEASDGLMDDNLGYSCWLQGDFAVGGAIGEDSVAVNAGAAYLFEFDGASWNEIAKLIASNGAIGDDLGREVIVQGDFVMASSRVAKPLVGAKVGGVYVFDTAVNAGAMHADFVASPREGQDPLVVEFDDASVGGATSWSWDFGDGFVSAAQRPTHTYFNFGTFDVSLTVTGALGNDSITKVGHIVADVLPASATVRNGSGTNDTCYQAVTTPVIGGTLTTTVDGTNHPSAGLTLVLGYDQFLTGVPTPFGELLVAPEPFGGFLAYGTVVDSAGGVATHSSVAPNDVTFVGTRLYSQGVILGGAGPELCNAIDLIIGW